MHTARDTGRARALPTTPDPSRRRLFATAASALAAGVVLATAARGAPIAEAGGGDAELIAACHAFLNAEAEVQADNASDDDSDDATAEASDHWYAALERLTALPALTPAGMRLKARAAHIALLSTEGPGGLQREETAALSALFDMIGRAAA